MALQKLRRSSMNLKSLIPIGRERSLARRDDPFLSLQREIDRLFDDLTRWSPALPTGGVTELLPSMDVTETDKQIEITAELPGLEEKDVQVNVADNVLTIRGEKKAEKEEKGKAYRLVERSYGSFMRSLELPEGVDADAIKATIEKGVLKVTVPKPAPAQAKKIEVKPAA
jgi:HSP20 family protein